MMLRLVFRPAARIELREARRCYESQQKGLGLVLARTVVETLDRIATNPALYPVVEDGVRRAVVCRRYGVRLMLFAGDASQSAAGSGRTASLVVLR